MKKVTPIYEEDYEECYCIPEYKDQVILEIGSDYGSTAYYFFTKGAKQVISIESAPSLHEKALENREGDENWFPICETIESSEQLTNLLLNYKPTILHMDCECCEHFLIGVPKEAFESVEWAQIEIHHSVQLHEMFFKKFEELEYDLIRDYVYRECWITVWRKGK
jgi:hypothetical protein